MHRALAALVAALALMLPRPAAATPGALDRSFSGNGIQTIFLRGGSANAVAIDGAGRIVVAGSVGLGSSDVAVARLRPGGVPDPAFGGDGRVRIDLGADDVAQDVAIAPDGGVVLVGERRTANGSAWFVLRLGSGGARDRSFGTNGLAITDFGRRYETANAVAVLGDGRVVATGGAYDGTSERWAFARYRTNGTLDGSFGGDGKVLLSLSVTSAEAQDLVLVDGGLLAGGYAERRYVPRFAVVKLRGDGTRARAFGDRGVRIVDVSAGADAGFGLALTPRGGAVVAGYASNGGRADWGLAKLRSGGNLDRRFGGDGIVVTPFTAAYELAAGVAVQSDGRIVAVGRIRGPGDTDDLAVVRYLWGGGVNREFSGDGKALFDPSGEDDGLLDVVVRSGKIVAVGETMVNGVERMVVIRLWTS
jgi:uncharacterized delta-60 repeat protein